MSEEDLLLSKISRVAGHINRRKDASSSSRSSHSGLQLSRHRSPSRLPYSIRHEGVQKCHHTRNQPVPAHRNKTLILHHSQQKVGNIGNRSRFGADIVSTSHSSDWISKRDCHAQLIHATSINSKPDIGIAEISGWADGSQLSPGSSLFQSQQEPARIEHKLVVNGLRYIITHEGRKLVRDRASVKESQETPPSLIVNGVHFSRGNDGHMYRGIEKHDSRTDRETTEKDALCKRFTAMGQCSKGPRCPFIHDPTKVAICREFLRTGACLHGNYCDLSHTSTYERVPACLHFLRGLCSKQGCRYAHVHVDTNAQICEDFALLGFCDKGVKCPDRHVFECPSYANTGKCQNQQCRLPHVDRAGQLRKHDTRPAPTGITKYDNVPTATSITENDVKTDEDFCDSSECEASQEMQVHKSQVEAKEEDFIHLEVRN